MYIRKDIHNLKSIIHEHIKKNKKVITTYISIHVHNWSLMKILEHMVLSANN